MKVFVADTRPDFGYRQGSDSVIYRYLEAEAFGVIVGRDKAHNQRFLVQLKGQFGPGARPAPRVGSYRPVFLTARPLRQPCDARRYSRAAGAVDSLCPILCPPHT